VRERERERAGNWEWTGQRRFCG